MLFMQLTVKQKGKRSEGHHDMGPRRSGRLAIYQLEEHALLQAWCKVGGNACKWSMDDVIGVNGLHVSAHDESRGTGVDGGDGGHGGA